jgi:hypothetical protein
MNYGFSLGFKTPEILENVFNQRAQGRQQRVCFIDREETRIGNAAFHSGTPLGLELHTGP